MLVWRFFICTFYFQLKAHQLFSASFNVLPALNFGTVTAGIWIFSCGFWGLTPILASRRFEEKVPKPVMVTSPPLLMVEVMISTKPLTAPSDCGRERLALAANCSISSNLFIIPLLSFIYDFPRVCSHLGFSQLLLFVLPLGG